MARLDAPIGASVTKVSFTAVLSVTVVHNSGRYPIVEVLVEASGGIFGFGYFGDQNFGNSSYLLPLPKANYDLVHLDENTFEVDMNTNYTGHIMYV
jgi:hypothetical protein